MERRGEWRKGCLGVGGKGGRLQVRGAAAGRCVGRRRCGEVRWIGRKLGGVRRERAPPWVAHPSRRSQVPSSVPASPSQTPPSPAPPECRTEPHRCRNMAGDMPDLRRPSWHHRGWLAGFSFQNTEVSTVAGIMAKTEGAMWKDGWAGNIGLGDGRLGRWLCCDGEHGRWLWCGGEDGRGIMP